MHIINGKATLININIYEEEALVALKEKFDLIILKDVIEHIPNQEKFIPYIKQFLKPGGRIFFGFPLVYATRRAPANMRKQVLGIPSLLSFVA